MKNLKKVLVVLAVIAVIIFLIVRIVKTRVQRVMNVEDAYMNQIVDVYTVKKDDVKSYIKGVGKITSFNIETLPIDVGEKIEEMYVSEGEKVEKNDKIMKVTNGASSRVIKASISGMFFVIENDQGTAYVLYNLDDIGLKLSLPEKDISSVKIDQEVEINIEALEKTFTGKVAYISSLPQNDRYTVRVKVEYTDEIKFGYSGIASILVNEKENVITIPYEYLNMSEDGSYYVYKEDAKDEYVEYYWNSADSEKLKDLRTYIEIGEITANNVEIVSGLEEGDKIITFGW